MQQTCIIAEYVQHFILYSLWQHISILPLNGYLDDLLNIDNPYFEQMVGQIYPTELQLYKATSIDIEGPFLGLDLPIIYDIISAKI